jgi:exopolysaccharide biosynthesis predicted pyruvyltransferase EpsI/glycosyltransferase involved in cell wall biosynthesis
MKDGEIKFSVVLPIYNVDLFLNRCIESIVKQTYRNLEIILVDDGSTDYSPIICDKWKAYDERIIVLHKENNGLGEARNSGLDMATGDYICFFDSDDYVKGNLFEDLAKVLQNNRVDLIIFGHYFLSAGGTIKKSFIPSMSKYKFNNNKEIMNELLPELICTDLKTGRASNLYMSAWSFAFKREKLIRTQFRFESERRLISEDIYSLISLIPCIDSARVINKAYYYHCENKKSLTNTYRPDRFDKTIFCQKMLIKLCESRVYSDEVRQRISRPFLDNILACIKMEAVAIKDKGLRKVKERIKIICKDPLVRQALYEIPKASFSKARRILHLCIKHRLYTLTIILIRLMRAYKSLYYADTGSLLEKVLRRYRVLQYILSIFVTFSGNSQYLINRDREPSIFLIDTPEYKNLGDHAIAYGELKYLKKYFPEYRIYEITDSKFYFYFYQLKRKIRPTDIIILHGGGNIGNQYPVHEHIRRIVIRAFPENKIIVFPQTVYFTDDYIGNKELKKSKKIYKKHKDLTIIAREHISYDIMKEHFNNNNILLTPDIAMYLRQADYKSERIGALICLRDDIEKAVSDEEKQEIKRILGKYFDRLTERDTWADYQVKISERYIALDLIWQQFSRVELVITDRLHGMIFAAITETPCICYRNYNHKIEASYKWLEPLPYIQYLSSLDKLEDAVDRLRALNPKDIHYNNEFAAEHLEKVREMIKAQTAKEQEEGKLYSYEKVYEQQ